MLVGSVSWVRVGAFDLVSSTAAGRLVLVWDTVFNCGFAQIMLAQMSHYLLMWGECCSSSMLLCASRCWSFLCYMLWIRDGPNVRLWHSAEAEGLGRLTERVPNVRPNFGRSCALGWNNVFYCWAHWAARKCRSK